MRSRHFATISITSTTAQAAVLNLVGPDITTQNEILYGFSSVCLGTFQVDDVGDQLVWPDATYPRSGIILSTGSADSIVGPNDNDIIDPDEDEDATPDPNPVFPMGNDDDDGEGFFFDACTLEFEFLCTGSSEIEPTSFSYVFGSEEYLEYVDDFNDKFQFLLNGENIALLPNGDPVEINNVNNEDNADRFNNNVQEVGEPPYNVEADGFTSVLTASGNCSTTANGGWNKIKLVIADANDRSFDSWVLLGASTFVGGAPPTPLPSQQPSARPSFAPSFGPTPVSTGTLTMRRTPPPSSMPSSEPTPDGLGAGQPTLQPSTIVVAPKKVICQCPPDED